MVDISARRAAAKSLLTAVGTEVRSAHRLKKLGVLPAVGEFPAVAAAARSAKGAAIPAVLAARFGDDVAVIDNDEPTTFRELSDQTSRWVNFLVGAAKDGQVPTVGFMCRNSTLLIIAMLGSLSSGARIVFLNTDMGATQLATVCAREKVDIVVADQEFVDRIDNAVVNCRVVVASHEEGIQRETMAGLIAESSPANPPKISSHPELVILTSGSTGTPKGAARNSSAKTIMSTLAGLLEKIPFHRGDVIYLAPPAFHGWGLIATLCGLLSGATLVFSGRFSAEHACETMTRHRATAFVAVPTMLKRFMDLPAENRAPLDGQLHIIGSGGARIDPNLVLDITKEFGPVVHNLYGATEVSYVTIATPEDLAHDPTCAGSPPLGVTVAILRDGQPVPAGEEGVIHVRTSAQMKSYTDGRTKDTVNGMVSTGDLGYLDAAGRLYVCGRSDGMIVSGGENVYPEEVELALTRHPLIDDSTVFTVDDADFGLRIAAVVAPAPGAILNADDIKTYIATELSRSRVPRDIVMVPAIQRTATGKVTRSWIESLAGETA